MTVTPIRRRMETVTYVMALTGYSRPAIYKMAREGRIPAIRHGRSVRFDPDALDRWLTKLPKASA